MKPFSFLRTTWRKKDSKSSTPTPTPSPPDPALVTEAISVSTLPRIRFGKRGSILSVQSNSAAQVQQARAEETANSPPQTYGQEVEKPRHAASGNKHPVPQSIPRFRSHHGAPFNSSHGPPHNLSHGPPNFSISSRELDDPSNDSSTPLCPPRPPFLDPWSRSSNQGSDFVSVPRSPTRVKFSPAPQTRPSRPAPSQPSSRGVYLNANNYDQYPISRGAPLKDTYATFDSQKSDSCCSQESESVYSQESALSSSKDERRIAIPLSDRDRIASTYKHSDPAADPDPPSLKEKPIANTVVNRSELRNPHIPNHATATTHLPSTKSGASHTKSEITRGNSGKVESSQAVLPSTPPLFFRSKRPEPLVLLPSPRLAAARPPPSPAFSSTDSTPLATPTSFSSASRRPQSPSPLKNMTKREFYRTSPPTSSPPNGPLPTPPASPSYDAPSTPRLSVLPGRSRTLHTAQSTTDLQDLRDLRVERRKLSSAHGSTSSALVSGKHFSIGDSGRHVTSQAKDFTMTYLVRLFLQCSLAQLLIYV
jgi:hypothetical protein